MREFPVFRHITKLQKLALPLTLTYRLRRWFSGAMNSPLNNFHYKRATKLQLLTGKLTVTVRVSHPGIAWL